MNIPQFLPRRTNALRLLFSQDPRDAFQEAYQLLVPRLQEGEIARDRIINVLQNTCVVDSLTSHDIFPIILEALVLEYPGNGFDLLNVLNASITSRFTVSQAPLALVLGVLKAQAFFDQNERYADHGDKYEPELAKLLVGCVFGKGDFSTGRSSRSHLDELAAQKQLLSEALMKFIGIRGGARVSVRKKLVSSIFEAIQERIDSKKEELSPFGKVFIFFLCKESLSTLSAEEALEQVSSSRRLVSSSEELAAATGT